MPINFVKRKTFWFLYNNMAPMRMFLCWLSLSLSYVFFVSDTNYFHDRCLIELMPSVGWSILFLSYSAYMLITCFTNLERFFTCLMDVLGLWLWAYLFLGFVIMNTSQVYSINYMFVAPILASVWLILDRLYKYYK